MGLILKLELLYYKYAKPEKVGVKRGEYHRPELYQSDAELMPRWRAIREGFSPCANCFGAGRSHGEFDDTRGQVDWEALKHE
jgi:hypothetical protein